MARMQLVELEDLRWMPATWRNQLTEVLRFVLTTFRLYQPAVPMLQKLMRHMGTQKVVDLCSGSSGPWEWLLPRLERTGCKPQVTLTDKYPNFETLSRIKGRNRGRIDFMTSSVDARNVPAFLDGIRTIFTGFHHLPPEIGFGVLKDAKDNRKAIALFEFTSRKPVSMILMALTPVMIWLMAPFIRPFHFQRFFWTYVIPVMPFFVTWDGIVSNLRTYSPEELEEMIRPLRDEDYVWEIGEQWSPWPFRMPITYLLGYPRQPVLSTPQV